MVTLGERIKFVREKLGLNQSSLAAQLGLGSATVVSRYESNLRQPDIAILVKLAELAKISIDELLTGESSRTDDFFVIGPGRGIDPDTGDSMYMIRDRGLSREMPASDIELRLNIPEGSIDEYLMEQRSSQLSEKIAHPDDDFVFVPQVNGAISAGGGLVADDSVEMRIAFRREWIQRRGDPQNMSLIRVSGDSMEPTLLSGDLVLIDHNRNFVDPQGGIYAIALNDSIMIKRLQVIYPAKTLKIISDNNRYEPLEAMTDQVRVNGKVIWFGREIER